MKFSASLTQLAPLINRYIYARASLRNGDSIYALSRQQQRRIPLRSRFALIKRMGGPPIAQIKLNERGAAERERAKSVKSTAKREKRGGREKKMHTRERARDNVRARALLLMSRLALCFSEGAGICKYFVRGMQAQELTCFALRAEV